MGVEPLCAAMSIIAASRFKKIARRCPFAWTNVFPSPVAEDAVAWKLYLVALRALGARASLNVVIYSAHAIGVAARACVGMTPAEHASTAVGWESAALGDQEAAAARYVLHWQTAAKPVRPCPANAARKSAVPRAAAWPATASASRRSARPSSAFAAKFAFLVRRLEKQTRLYNRSNPHRFFGAQMLFLLVHKCCFSGPLCIAGRRIYETSTLTDRHWILVPPSL